MGLGVLEVHGSSAVPGTVTLLEKEKESTPEAVVIDSRLKYVVQGDRHILLVPQPTDDPNDPLNWSLRRRDLILCGLSLLSIIATTLSPILAANSLDLAIYFGLQFPAVTVLTGYHLLGVAIGGILCVPSAQIWGKRHLYLLGTLIIIVSSIWAGVSNLNYNSLLWARLFQGIGLAPFEALMNATVGDMYHLHQRGKRMALSNLSLFGGAFFTPVIVGKMTSSIGWQWTFYFLAIFAGALFPVIFFFVPETTYRRQDNTDKELGRVLGLHTINRDMKNPEATEVSSEQKLSGEDEGSESKTAHEMPRPAPPAKVTYAQSLMPFNGRHSDESYWKLFLRPFPLFLHPGILWACLTQGCLIGWTVLIGIVLAAIMFAPPLLFTEDQTGYMYTGAFVGALFGFLISGAIADPTTKWMARRNNGIYEPEFKIIVLVIPQLILGCAGLYGFGITANSPYEYRWYGPVVFFGCEVAGMVCGAVASALYIVDAYRDLTIEAFTCIIIFKNIFSFALTFPGYDWLVQYGPKNIFVIIGSVQVGLCALTIPMYVFGKRLRAFLAKHDMLGMLGLR